MFSSMREEKPKVLLVFLLIKRQNQENHCLGIKETIAVFWNATISRARTDEATHQYQPSKQSQPHNVDVKLGDLRVTLNLGDLKIARS